MSIPARWSILLAFACFECSSSNVNDERASGGSGSIGGGGNSGSGGSGGSLSGGASGVGAIAGEAGSGAAPNLCSGSALECFTCCEADQPDGYAEFLEEFKSSQCGAQACSGTCGAVCSGSSESMTPTCAECFFLNEPNVNTQVGLACKLSDQVDCQAFVSCLEACRLE